MDDRTSDKEQRRAKSTKRRLIRIFLSGLRWLAVIVLSGLIIGGLYVQAPWKVVALAAVLLADTPEAKLIDPVSGEWFVYERDDEGFIVYSAGMEMSKFDTKTGQMIKQHEIIEIWPE